MRPSVGFTDERLRLVAESMGGVIFDYDIASRTTFWDDAVKGMFGWEQYELTEAWWAERIHPDDLDRVRRTVLPVRPSRARDALGGGVPLPAGRWHVTPPFSNAAG